jgi:3D (Asp-Asp-Asp) domain-containing protein
MEKKNRGTMFVKIWNWLKGLAAAGAVVASSSAAGKSVVLRSTYYILCLESDYAPSDLHMFDLLDVDGKVLARVTEKFKKAAEIEGSLKLRDGRVLNYAGIKGGIYRWKTTPFQHGINAMNGPLVPMQSAAVDPKVIKLGSRLAIEGLPGVWIADDVGGAIKGDRIDLFAGDGHAAGELLNKHGYGDHKAVKVTIL